MWVTERNVLPPASINFARIRPIPGEKLPRFQIATSKKQGSSPNGSAVCILI
jgi:hypothetical protein